MSLATKTHKSLRVGQVERDALSPHAPQNVARHRNEGGQSMTSGRHHEQWHLHGKEPEALFLTVRAGNPEMIFMQEVEAPIASPQE